MDVGLLELLDGRQGQDVGLLGFLDGRQDRDAGLLGFLDGREGQDDGPLGFLDGRKDWPLAEKPLHVVQLRTLDIQEGRPLAAERPEIQISHGSRRVCCSRWAFRVPSGSL